MYKRQIWKTAKKTPVWDKADGHYHRSEKGGGQWSFTRRLPESWQIGYDLITGQKLTFNIRPTGFKHTGLFPEQAVNWDFMAKMISERILVRESGTEPLIRVMIEGKLFETINEMAVEIADVIRRCCPEI